MRIANRVIAFLGVAAVCAMTSVEAAAIDLSPGDLVVVDSCNKKLLRVDPVTGTQTVIYSGAFQPRSIAFEADGDLLITDETVDGGALSGSIARRAPSPSSSWAASWPAGSSWASPSTPPARSLSPPLVARGRTRCHPCRPGHRSADAPRRGILQRPRGDLRRGGAGRHDLLLDNDRHPACVHLAHRSGDGSAEPRLNGRAYPVDRGHRGRGERHARRGRL